MKNIIVEYEEKGREQLSERGFFLRHGALHAASQLMLYIGAKNESKRRDGCKGPESCKNKRGTQVKRRWWEKRKCTNCKRTVHTKKRCLERVGLESKERETDDLHSTARGTSYEDCRGKRHVHGGSKCEGKTMNKTQRRVWRV
ncbi:hypothetical protein PIB30_023711 [Stylosanthes scabra]|uniref:Uncharacterized protein n=1 Tax=Stylosanthes scabra TaxID=79078 RepID=A0ABU6U9J9_9FABA|nr:hypothetical protein [Stylosanthes scabra]